MGGERFRSWCADTGVPREVAEKRAGGIEAAHNRGSMIGRRKVMAGLGRVPRGRGRERDSGSVQGQATMIRIAIGVRGDRGHAAARQRSRRARSRREGPAADLA